MSAPEDFSLKIESMEILFVCNAKLENFPIQLKKQFATLAQPVDSLQRLLSKIVLFVKLEKRLHQLDRVHANFAKLEHMQI